MARGGKAARIVDKLLIALQATSEHRPELRVPRHRLLEPRVTDREVGRAGKELLEVGRRNHLKAKEKTVAFEVTELQRLAGQPPAALREPVLEAVANQAGIAALAAQSPLEVLKLLCRVLGMGERRRSSVGNRRPGFGLHGRLDSRAGLGPCPGNRNLLGLLLRHGLGPDARLGPSLPPSPVGKDVVREQLDPRARSLGRKAELLLVSASQLPHRHIAARLHEAPDLLAPVDGAEPDGQVVAKLRRTLPAEISATIDLKELLRGTHARLGHEGLRFCKEVSRGVLTASPRVLLKIIQECRGVLLPVVSPKRARARPDDLLSPVELLSKLG